MNKLYTNKQVFAFAEKTLKTECKKMIEQAIRFYSINEEETKEKYLESIKDIYNRDRLDVLKAVKKTSKTPIKTMREYDHLYNAKKIFSVLVWAAKVNYTSNLEKCIDDLRKIADFEAPKTIRIEVLWKKNSTWGANPVAEVWENEYLGASRSVGGCGYDKESTAIAECFNRSGNMAFLAWVAKYIDSRYDSLNWKDKQKKGIYTYSYGVRPTIFHKFGIYWEGGVGASSFMNCLKCAGYKINSEVHPKYFDFYNLSRG